ncbi:cytosine permease [Marinitoga sp. 1197]|uniref:cytosine permease n=1 Tax=unclassified Marinitoga TaxID=2640159 RepID=UPI000640E7A5|nr:MULTISPECIES: cytosine permease [unclassified Marinitoga]KLO21466.1 cytosine permease [Marinitoga sp. 1197]KLO24905.1 cytosine permease [Marinitoga sp. 1155]
MADEEILGKKNEELKEGSEDFPLVEVPISERKGFWSISVVLLGFTFFTATMWAGGNLGVSFKFWPDLMLLIVAGNLLLGLYVAILGYIAFKTGLSTVLLGRYSFGDWGSKWPDFILGFTQIGWYAWGTATIAILLTKFLNLPQGWNIPLMILFGFAFSWTAYVGYRGLEWLSRFSVPLMTILIIWSMTIATKDAGGLAGILGIEPTKDMTTAAAITIIFGTFVSGGTQSTNWTRFSKTAYSAVFGSLVAFFIGNGLMIFAGAYGGLVYQEPDIVNVLVKQGLLFWGIVMLFLNIWTTQDNTIYNFSVAGCNFFRTEKRRYFTIGGAAIGTILAILGMYNWLIPWLVLLGTFIPPIGGVIMADFFYKHKMKYPKITNIKFQKFNWSGVLGYIAGALIAKYSPGVPPINGIIGAFVFYVIFDILLKVFGINNNHEIVVGEES